MGKCARCHNDQSFMHNWLDYGPASAKRWEIKRRVWDSWRGAYFKQPMPTGNSPESVAMSEVERTIIRDWVQSGAPRGALPEPGTLLSKADKIEAGKRLFGSVCAACHQPTGGGIPGRFPPLAGSDFLNSDKHRAIKALINGLQGEIVVNGQKFNNSMPKFPLSDGDIASALTYVYSVFGNSGQEVMPQEVKAARVETEQADSAAPSQTAKSLSEPSPYE
jgi:mono/diheme cytochrome c family protein